MSIPAIVTICSEVVRHVARGAVRGPFRGVRRQVSHVSRHVSRLSHHVPRHIPARLEIVCHAVGVGLIGVGVVSLGMTAGEALAPAPAALVADAGADGPPGPSATSGGKVAARLCRRRSPAPPGRSRVSASSAQEISAHPCCPRISASRPFSPSSCRSHPRIWAPPSRSRRRRTCPRHLRRRAAISRSPGMGLALLAAAAGAGWATRRFWARSARPARQALPSSDPYEPGRWRTAPSRDATMAVDSFARERPAR